VIALVTVALGEVLVPVTVVLQGTLATMGLASLFQVVQAVSMNQEVIVMLVTVLVMVALGEVLVPVTVVLQGTLATMVLAS
jgi:hypothetical protein